MIVSIYPLRRLAGASWCARPGPLATVAIAVATLLAVIGSYGLTSHAAGAAGPPACPPTAGGVALQAESRGDIPSREGDGVTGEHIVRCEYRRSQDGSVAHQWIHIQWRDGPPPANGLGYCHTSIFDSTFLTFESDRYMAFVQAGQEFPKPVPDSVLLGLLKAVEPLASPCAGAAPTATAAPAGGGATGTGAGSGGASGNGLGSANNNGSGGGIPVAAVAGAAVVVVVAGGLVASRRPSRPRHAGGPSMPGLRLPPTDAYGEPLIVQDGRYAGGKPGQVWWNGHWIDPGDALREIDKQRVAIDRRDQEATQFAHDTGQMWDRWNRDRVARDQAERLGEIVRREQEDLRRRQVAAQKAGVMRTMADAARERQQALGDAAFWGGLENAAEWTAWGADRSIDILSNVTGPLGKTVKDAYTVAKRVGKGVGEGMAEMSRDGVPAGEGLVRAAKRVGLGTMEGLGDLGFSKFVAKSGLMNKVFGQPPAVPGSPDWSGRAVRDVGRAVLGDAGTRRVAGSALDAAFDGYVRNVSVRDPLKNAAENAWHWRWNKGLTDPRDPLTKLFSRDLGPSMRTITSRAIGTGPVI